MITLFGIACCSHDFGNIVKARLMKRNDLAFGIAAIVALWAGAASAQSCLGRPDFDACMANITGAAQANVAAQQQQLWQSYLQTYGPWLQQQYAQSPARNSMTFEQFAYWEMMTANGTNVAGAVQAQQNQFAGSQRANSTVQQGYSDYNQGAAANSAATDNTLQNYDQQAVRGNSPQIDPETGQTVELPYTDQPDNQPFNYGGQTYVHTASGYFEWNGSGWTAMQAGN